MVVSHEKSTVTASGIEGSINITVNCQPLENVYDFKYHGIRVGNDASSTAEIVSCLSMAMSKMTESKKLWKSHDKRLLDKISLFHSQRASVALYGCESWTLTFVTERGIQTFDMKCFRKKLNISYIEQMTNESYKINRVTPRRYELILTIVMLHSKLKLLEYCASGTLS